MIARKRVKNLNGNEIISNRYKRNNDRKRVYNRARKSKVRTSIKKFLSFLKTKPAQDKLKDEHIKLQKSLMSKKAIDVFGLNKCSRMFSRMTKRIKV
ncbi:MAG: 30S ribosomal protein S20 [Pseudomonadota bacterium]